MTIGNLLVALLALVPLATESALARSGDEGTVLHVDPERGRDGAEGSERRPLRSLSAALAKLPSPLTESVTIRLEGGEQDSTGGVGMPERSLELAHPMRPSVTVTIEGPAEGEPAVLAWTGERRMVEVSEGNWRLARLRIGSFSKDQRRGVTVRGPARVVLEDVTFRLRSHSDAGIWAVDGGRVSLRGAIRLNEHLHEEAEDETFCGVLATDHGVVEFDEREGSSLELGNGNLSVRYYGSIRLGCESARITCWTKSNNLTVNNGGRIDLLNTPTELRAKLRNNTPIGLEHDGHVLAEDAHITIHGPNDSAIALQKASTFTCNDIELVGDFEFSIWARSGSMFVGRFLGDVTKVRARTGAQIHVEAVGGTFHGPADVASGGLITVGDEVFR